MSPPSSSAAQNEVNLKKLGKNIQGAKFHAFCYFATAYQLFKLHEVADQMLVIKLWLKAYSKQISWMMLCTVANRKKKKEANHHFMGNLENARRHFIYKYLNLSISVY